MVSLDDVKSYLESNSWSDDEITDVLNVERVAQSKVCDVDDPPSADLDEALKRRVQRNLSLRGQKFIVTPDDNGQISITPSRDPEVKRLEAPYRKLTVG